MLIKSLVEKFDPENQFDVLVNSFEQVKEAWETNVDTGKIELGRISNVVVSGLGGSAIAGDLLRNFLSNAC